MGSILWPHVVWSLIITYLPFKSFLWVSRSVKKSFDHIHHINYSKIQSLTLYLPLLCPDLFVLNHPKQIGAAQNVPGIWSSTRALLTYQGLHYKTKMTLPSPEGNIAYHVCVFPMLGFGLVFAFTGSAYAFHDRCVCLCLPLFHNDPFLLFQKLYIYINITNYVHIIIFGYFTFFVLKQNFTL